MEKKSHVIAIDGPSGSGKSTIAKIVAAELSLTYLDTGAMFRGLALAISKAGIEFDDIDRINTFLRHMSFDYGHEDYLIKINGEDLTISIRDHEVSQMASQISQLTVVRDFLKEAQRKIAKVRPSILEGRDIGSVIFPDAAFKFFLTADARIRAKRRFDELLERGTLGDLSLKTILADIESRDLKDRTRKIAPLIQAKDALLIDTSHLSIEKVAETIIDIYRNKKAQLLS